MNNDYGKYVTVLYMFLAVSVAAFLCGVAIGREDSKKACAPSSSSDGIRIVKKPVHDTIYISYPLPSETVFVPVPADVDTAQILSNYFSLCVYEDTVRIGDYVDLSITDSVTCNKLISHKIDVLGLPELYVPPSAVSARCVALGAVTGKNLLALKVDLSLKTHTISAGYDFCNKSPVIGYSYKIAKW